jgi:hypothetical protein
LLQDIHRQRRDVGCSTGRHKEQQSALSCVRYEDLDRCSELQWRPTLFGPDGFVRIQSSDGLHRCEYECVGFTLLLLIRCFVPLSAFWRVQDGKTWGAPTQLDQFLGDKGHAAAGPGVGIQLTQGKHKGRLLFIGHRGAYVQDSVWFSDDGGKTYSTSDTILQEMVRCTVSCMGNHSRGLRVS